MPLPFVVAAVVKVGVGAAARVIARQAATAAAKKAAAAAARKAAEEATKKAAAEGLKRQAAEAAAKAAARRAAQESLKKAAPKAGGKGRGNTAGKHEGKKGRKKKDPCKHLNDKKKKDRKYVVYKVTDRNGNVYVGRSSGSANSSVRSILAKRSAGHHRPDVKGLALEEVFRTDRYAAVRGAEQIAKEKYGNAKQIEPISDRNDRRQDYIDCAKSKM